MLTAGIDFANKVLVLNQFGRKVVTISAINRMSSIVQRMSDAPSTIAGGVFITLRNVTKLP